MMHKNATLLKPVTPYAALLLISGSEKFLVVSDLHLGWETSLAEEGIHIPSQTSKLLKKIERVISLANPDCLIVLGDVKHTVEKIEIEEWRDVPIFFEKLRGKLPCIKVVPGNHDGNIEVLLPEGVEIMPQQGMMIGDVGLFHGHAWPDIKMLACETLVVGHIHPSITFKDPLGFRITNQIWVRAPCNSESLARAILRRYNIKFKADEDVRTLVKSSLSVEIRVKNLLIMPSFNDFLGGRTINKASIARETIFKDFMGPILRSGSVNLSKAEVYLLDGTFVGSLEQLSILE